MEIYYAVLAYIAVGALLAVAFDGEGAGEWRGPRGIALFVTLWPLMLPLALCQGD